MKRSIPPYLSIPLFFAALFGSIVVTTINCGCQVGTNPTTQQVVDAQAGNARIAKVARLTFEAWATKVEFERARGKSSPAIDALEDGLKNILDQMDIAAKGDPNEFAALAKKAAEKQFWLEVDFLILQ